MGQQWSRRFESCSIRTFLKKVCRFDWFLYIVLVTETTKHLIMKEQLESYISACEENIARYKEMGDERAVKAATTMLDEFRKMLSELN